MLIYFSMIALSACFAFFATKLNQTYTIKINKVAKIITVKQSHIFAFLSFLPVFFVSALRYQVGVDYMSYFWIFQAVERGEPIHAESGYRFLNEFLINYTNDPQSIFIVTSFITLSLIFYGIYKYSPNPGLSIFLLVSMGYLFSSFNILRQYVAIALVFASLKLIKENKFFPFLLIIIAAMTFHKTAIILLPLFYLIRLRLKQSYLFIITLVSACFIPLRGVLTNLLTNVFYPQYAGTDLIKPLSMSEFLYYLLVLGALVLLCMAYKNKFFDDTYNLILFNCIFYSLILYTCFSFVPEINRIAVYIELFIVILIPRVIKAEQNKKVRNLYYIITIISFTAFFILSVGIMKRFGVLPYTTVFSR